MRQGIELFLAPHEEEWSRGNPLFHILFASMTAKPTADAFFGMATAVAHLDPAETAVRNVLRHEWEAHTTFRNDLAHAEWSVGWEDAETQEPVPPGSIRIKNVDGVPTLTNLGIDTNAIIAEINTLLPLVKKLQVFAHVCRERQLEKVPTILHRFTVIDPVANEPRQVALTDA